MNAAGKVAIGGLAAAAAVGVGVLIARKMAAAPTPTPAGPTPGVPPQGSTVWVRASTIAPGQQVRLAVDPTELDVAAQTIPGIGGTDLPGFESLLASPEVQTILRATSILAWAPGDAALPADWPPDDTDAATEYHAQLVYGGNAPLLVSAIPFGLRAWVPKGTGA